MVSRTSLRRICWLGAAICFGELLIPNFSVLTTDDGSKTQGDMGPPVSSWFHFEDECTETKRNGETAPSVTTKVRTDWKFEFVSWSVLSMLAGIAFLIAARCARQQHTGLKVPG